LPDNIWCKKDSFVTARDIALHEISLSLRGKAFTRVHEENGAFLSYYGAFMRGRTTTFTIAVVNLDVPDPMQLFRHDATKALQAALENGSEQMRISTSSDDAQYVKWAENEVGMKRYKDKNLWIGDYGCIKNYIDRALIF
jgi:hypothetical protein